MEQHLPGLIKGKIFSYLLNEITSIQKLHQVLIKAQGTFDLLYYDFFEPNDELHVFPKLNYDKLKITQLNSPPEDVDSKCLYDGKHLICCITCEEQTIFLQYDIKTRKRIMTFVPIHSEIKYSPNYADKLKKLFKFKKITIDLSEFYNLYDSL